MAWGALAYRRREIKRLAERIKKNKEEKAQLSGGEEGVRRDDPDRWTMAEDSPGIKRFRTLMMVNVPPDSEDYLYIGILTLVRDEEMIRAYFDHYLHQHRIRKGQAQITGRMVPPSIAGKQFPADRVHHRVLHPGSLFTKQQVPKEVELPPVTPTLRIQDMEKIGRDSGEHEAEAATADGEDWSPTEDIFDSEVDEIILVRKLGAIESLRSRRQAVLKDLEMVGLIGVYVDFVLTPGSREPRSACIESSLKTQSSAKRTAGTAIKAGTAST